MKLVMLLLPCVQAFGIASNPHLFAISRPAVVRQQSPFATLTTKPNRVAARPVLVPALSYCALGATAVGASKVVAAAGYASSTAAGLSMPMLTVAAITAPALMMLIEFGFFGGGERVAKIMGGAPADAKLTKMVESVALRAGLEPPAHVFEIPTDELNAFAAGFGTNDATVAVTSGLRRKLSNSELEAVIAHEIGHIRHSDMRTSMHVAVAIAGLGGIYELGRIIARSESESDRDKDDDEEGSVLPLAYGMMLGGLGLRFAAHLLQLSMSRTAEYDADSVAAELCGREAMISALEKIQATANIRGASRADEAAPALSSFRGGAFAHAYISSGETSEDPSDKKKRAPGRPGSNWWKGVQTAFSTHPTTESRIAALKASPSGRR